MMTRFWFARPDSEYVARWAFTPINWKGYASLYFVPMFFGILMARVPIALIPLQEIPPYGPSPLWVGVSTAASLLFWYAMIWLLIRKKIDWSHKAADYRKGELVQTENSNAGEIP